MDRRPIFMKKSVAAPQKYDRRTSWERRHTRQRRASSLGPGPVRKLLAWLSGTPIDILEAPRAVRRRARRKARQAFAEKCQRRALRPQGCSIPHEVWA